MSAFNLKRYAERIAVAQTEDDSSRWDDVIPETPESSRDAIDTMNSSQLMMFCVNAFQMLDITKMTEAYRKLIEICNLDLAAADAVINSEDCATTMVLHMLKLIQTMPVEQRRSFAVYLKQTRE